MYKFFKYFVELGKRTDWSMVFHTMMRSLFIYIGVMQPFFFLSSAGKYPCLVQRLKTRETGLIGTVFCFFEN